jgi:hypothetical protein
VRRILTILMSGPVEDLVAAVFWSTQYLQDALNLLHDAIVNLQLRLRVQGETQAGTVGERITVSLDK